MDRRTLRIGFVLCALLLLWVATYPAAFSTLATTDQARYEHAVVPSASAEYDDRLEAIEDESDSDEVTLRERRYGELSPAARALYDRALDRPATQEGVHTYTPKLCKPDVHGCPHTHRSDLASELSYDRTERPSTAALIVVDDGERYLFTTPAAIDQPTGDGWEIRGLLVLALLLPAVVFLLTLAVQPSTRTRRIVAGIWSVPVAVIALTFLFRASLASDPSGLLLTVLATALGLFLVPVPLLGAPSEYGSRLGTVVLGAGAAVAVLAIAPAYLRAHTDLPGIDVAWTLGLALAWGGPLAIWVLDATTSHVSSSAGRSGPRDVN